MQQQQQQVLQGSTSKTHSRCLVVPLLKVRLDCMTNFGLHKAPEFWDEKPTDRDVQVSLSFS